MCNLNIVFLIDTLYLAYQLIMKMLGILIKISLMF